MAGVKTDEGRAARVKVFDFVSTWIKDKGYPPRTQDICTGVDMPYTTALWHLRSLRDQKALRFEDGAIGRTMRVGRGVKREAIE